MITASYDIASLTRFYTAVDVGKNGLIAVIGISDGSVRAMTGDVEPGANISATPMFAELRSAGSGLWSGPSPPDGRDRMHAFREVPGRDLTVVVGIDRAEALRTSSVWEGGALLFAGGLTLLLGLMGGMLIREGRTARGRETELARDRSELAEANARAREALDSRGPNFGIRILQFGACHATQSP